jgi:hypothetical protein
MNFIHSDFEVNGPAVAIVALNHQANVMLLDPMNYESYCARRLYLYVAGGWTIRSPLRLRIPSAGRWHIVVDLYGAPGHIVASIRLVDVGSNDPSLRRRRTQPLPVLKTEARMFPAPGQLVDGQLAPKHRAPQPEEKPTTTKAAATTRKAKKRKRATTGKTTAKK